MSMGLPDIGQMDPQTVQLLLSHLNGGQLVRPPLPDASAGTLPRPTPVVPQSLMPSQFTNERPLSLPTGGFADRLALALAQMPQSAPSTGFAGGLASGLARGFSTGQINDLAQREAFNQNQSAQSLERTKANAASEAARSLALYRHSLAAQDKADKTGGQTYTLPDGTVVPMTPGVANTLAKSKIPAAPSAGVGSGATDALVDQIASYKVDPNLSSRMKGYGDIVASMKARHPDFQWGKAQMLWNQTKKFNDTVNSQRFTALRQSVKTVADHLADFEQFNRDFDSTFKRLPYRLANKGIMWAAMNGYLGPDAASRAAALQSNRGAVAKELSVVLAGGYAPHEGDDRNADQTISMLWGPGQQPAAINAVKSLIRARVKNAQGSLPFAGGKDNPYLLDVTPMDVFDQTFPQEELPPGATIVKQGR